MGPGSRSLRSLVRDDVDRMWRDNSRFNFQTANPEAVIARSEATKQSILPLRGEMDCFASLAMTVSIALLLAMTSLQFQIRVRDLAARCARVVHESLAQQRAQGMPGAQCTRSLVCKKQTHERSHHGHTGTTRHSPLNGFTAYFALSPVTRLV